MLQIIRMENSCVSINLLNIRLIEFSSACYSEVKKNMSDGTVSLHLHEVDFRQFDKAIFHQTEMETFFFTFKSHSWHEQQMETWPFSIVKGESPALIA